ncbi:MAG TPA: hypothetical protein DDW49_06535 [Deltaproteobacteria bacterium]|nr:MAG: hypothetical protein A2048_10360 [Deltaproteobacteria bacterium GWA2_45_12]HBF13030.1 hypothetical protein [Deltaproteobacteria bacterium]
MHKKEGDTEYHPWGKDDEKKDKELCKVFHQWYEPLGQALTQDSVASYRVLTQQGASPKPTSVGDKK